MLEWSYKIYKDSRVRSQPNHRNQLEKVKSFISLTWFTNERTKQRTSQHKSGNKCFLRGRAIPNAHTVRRKNTGSTKLIAKWVLSNWFYTSITNALSYNFVRCCLMASLLLLLPMIKMKWVLVVFQPAPFGKVNKFIRLVRIVSFWAGFVHAWFVMILFYQIGTEKKKNVVQLPIILHHLDAIYMASISLPLSLTCWLHMSGAYYVCTFMWTCTRRIVIYL